MKVGKQTPGVGRYLKRGASASNDFAEAAEEARSLPPPMARKGDWCQTFSGRAFWPLDPRPEEVDIYDIAHALATTNRFGGHARVPYSIAQHSVHVSRLVPHEWALVGLLHDAAEAYVGDWVAPLKRSLPPEVREIETRIAWAIGRRFDWTTVPLSHYLPKLPPIVKAADMVALATEARDLMSKSPRPWNLGVEPRPEKIVPLGWKEAKDLFLCRWYELSGDEDPGECGECSMPMELVRPGKSQPTCTCGETA